MTQLDYASDVRLVVATPAVPKVYPERDLFRLPYVVTSVVDSRDYAILEVVQAEQANMSAKLADEASAWERSHGSRWQSCWMAMHENVSFKENKASLLDLKVMTFDEFEAYQKDFVMRSPVNILTPATESEFVNLAKKGQACIADFESIVSTGRIAGSITEQFVKIKFDELPYSIRSDLSMQTDESLYFKRYTDVSRLHSYITRSEVLDYLTFSLESNQDQAEFFDSMLRPESNILTLEI